MRSGLLVIPDDMSVEALKGEAEFYLITEFLAKLQEREEKQQKLAEEQQQCQLIFKTSTGMLSMLLLQLKFVWLIKDAMLMNLEERHLYFTPTTN